MCYVCTGFNENSLNKKLNLSCNFLLMYKSTWFKKLYYKNQIFQLIVLLSIIPRIKNAEKSGFFNYKNFAWKKN